MGLLCEDFNPDGGNVYMSVKNIPENDLAPYYFHQGTNFFSYEYMGVHKTECENGNVYTFRVWAPNAVRVAVTGDFNSWCAEPATRITEAGIWEYVLRVPYSIEGNYYKFEVTGKDGKTWLKSDPYAFYSQTLENTASIIRCEDSFEWNDSEWLAYRKGVLNPPYRANSKKNKYFFRAPMNIYEMHLASWRTRDGACNSDGKHYLNYREIADELVPYVKKMGYTHVELLPVAEHPFDGSWGYQVCSYYAPTSRFGTPDDFKYFINKLHENGVGVILDWVPAHFPKDRHGLFEFDGQPLYEYQGADRMEHKGWGTRCFDIGRPEVQSFLISNALYWLREYHADGLRIDAVASMLYLDFDRLPGEWVPNEDGTNRNKEAIAFFQKLNTQVFAAVPDALMIAEESTSWPMITKPVYEGGLGFNFKWNMGWANDMFEYVALDPLMRKYQHSKLTFPLMYAFKENYVLPVSHDEVVHGKKSLLDKMFGGYEDKFATMRAFLLYMMTLPGKKLTFMGCEYGPFREWDYENQLEWFMLDYPKHAEMQKFTAVLNHLYLASPELWEIDTSWDGFQWIEPNDCDNSIISYRRIDTSGNELIAVINFVPVTRRGYRISVPKSGEYEEIFSTDSPEFGGCSQLNTEPVKAFCVGDKKDKNYAVEITVPALGGVIFKRIKKTKKNLK